MLFAVEPQYEMTTYVMGLLRKGPVYARGIQEGHMANIKKMAATGKLIVASADPAVKAGRLVVELHPWFAAAGLRVNDPK